MSQGEQAQAQHEQRAVWKAGGHQVGETKMQMWHVVTKGGRSQVAASHSPRIGISNRPTTSAGNGRADGAGRAPGSAAVRRRSRSAGAGGAPAVPPLLLSTAELRAARRQAAARVW